MLKTHAVVLQMRVASVVTTATEKPLQTLVRGEAHHRVHNGTLNDADYPNLSVLPAYKSDQVPRM